MFGNALGNGIVGGIQKSAAEKRQEELNKYAAMSAKLGADTSRKVNSSLNFDVELPNLDNDPQFQNTLAGLTPQEVALRDMSRDVSGINQLSASLKFDLSNKIQSSAQQQYRIDQLVADTSQLLGSNKDVELSSSYSLDGVAGGAALTTLANTSECHIYWWVMVNGALA